jgi:DNA primase
MAIPQSFLQELLARVDIVEVVGQYVQLKKGGANFSGLCPFHSEKSPSFSVSPSKQFFHCFGCGKNGNAIGFLMEHAGLNFIEAVKDLAQRTGMTVPEEPQDPAQRARQKALKAQQQSLGDVLDKAGAAWRQKLRESPRAIEYLRQRGLSGQIAKRFGLGYAPPGWRGLASVFARYDDPLLVEAGLVIASDAQAEAEHVPPDPQQAGATQEGGKRYDRFRDRIMFPIRNVRGDCIGFGGRVIGDGKPKYLNSPETPLFHKGRELYGLYEAREALHSAGYVLVTEGYMDVVALAQHGFANAVATLGTACTPEHVHKLFRFTDAVVFSFDGDAAGRRAARKALEGALPYATDTRSIRFLFLPAEHDPDSFIREHGQEAFAEQVRQAMPLSRFLVEAASSDCDLGTAEGRARMASQARPLWALLPEGALQQQLLVELSQPIGLAPEALQRLWRPDTASAAAAGAAARPEARSAEPAWESAGMPEAMWADAAPAPTPTARRPWRDGPRREWRDRQAPRGPAVATGPRTRPASRADHAARLLLGNMALWEHLGGEDQAMLCELPAPHGPLLAWLDALYHEHGPLGPSAITQELQGQAFAELARRWLADAALVQGGPDDSAPSAEGMQEARQELRTLLDLMLIDRLKAQETEALAQLQSGQDPDAMARYRSLQDRRAELMARQLKG